MVLAACQVASIGAIAQAIEPGSGDIRTIQFGSVGSRSMPQKSIRPATHNGSLTSHAQNDRDPFLGQRRSDNSLQTDDTGSPTVRNSVGCLTPSQMRDVVPSIQDVSLDVLRGPGEPPKSCFAEQHFDRESRLGNSPRWAMHNDYYWKPSALFSNPLYFEDVSLERYGRVSCIQNAVSGAKFFGTVAILPYKIGVDCPRECVYTLGHSRPGNWAPAVCECLPCSARGIALQAGAVTGVGLLFP
jgi:hypothetical protein